MRSEREKRRRIEKMEKLRRRHQEHEKWIMDARDWEDIPDREERRKWLESKLINYHDPKGWALSAVQELMLCGAQSEDAKNIGHLIYMMPPHRFARRFADMLLKDIE